VPSLLTHIQVLKMQAAMQIPYLESLWLRLAIYFIIGGTVTAFTAYFAGQGRGMLSAFITTLPLLTIFSFLLISAEGGIKTVEEYARSLLIFTPPWICYVATVLLGTSRWGLLRSLILGVLLFVVLSHLMQKILTGVKP
jgi:uncharacterized membrane protein (GlpM family)